MIWLKSFFAGFVSTLVFHQGMLWALNASGAANRAPFPMQPVGPLHVPAIYSLAFFGGLWGILLWKVLKKASGSIAYWSTAVGFGALGPSLVTLAVVFPLKGQPFMAGWDPKVMLGALLLNGAWGAGVGLFLRLFRI